MGNLHLPTGLMATRRELLKAAAAIGAVAAMPLAAFAIKPATKNFGP
ncbi:twin-arginine translocation signal domain-containing protein [Undibacterium arcticum]